MVVVVDVAVGAVVDAVAVGAVVDAVAVADDAASATNSFFLTADFAGTVVAER